VEATIWYLEEELKRITPEGPPARLVACGSFRRKKLFCGDVDVIILSDAPILSALVTHLHEQGFLLGDLQQTPSKYMGICRLETHARRLDMKVYAPDQEAFALLHWTGPAAFNRQLRLHAKKRGYKLSDQGLNRRVGHQAFGLKMTFPCETSVFQYLGLPYIPPENRSQNLPPSSLTVLTDK